MAHKKLEDAHEGYAAARVHRDDLGRKRDDLRATRAELAGRLAARTSPATGDNEVSRRARAMTTVQGAPELSAVGVREEIEKLDAALEILDVALRLQCEEVDRLEGAALRKLVEAPAQEWPRLAIATLARFAQLAESLDAYDVLRGPYLQTSGAASAYLPNIVPLQMDPRLDNGQLAAWVQQLIRDQRITAADIPATLRAAWGWK